MRPRLALLNKIATRRIRKRAAGWVTDLHGPDRNAELDHRIRLWIAEDPRHAAALERATDDWEDSGHMYAHRPGLDSIARRRARPKAAGPALVGMGALCVAIVAAVYLLRDDTLKTGPAEQRTVQLSDGTDVALNANTRLIVRYDAHVRKVVLVSGEALFSVIKHQPRPFVVVIGGRKVVALGTSFLVRREDPSASAFAVTLVEGRVAIEPTSWPNVLPATAVTGLKLLNPGERLRFEGDSAPKEDSPSIERVTAWQRGQLIFDDTSLSEAAAEFNRYGTLKLIIDDPRLEKLRVGGVFRIGDPSSFARAMANTYHLHAIEGDRTIVLTDKPAESP
jgi:transmembrane sensor